MVPCLEFDDVSLKGYKVVENTVSNCRISKNTNIIYYL